jgi:hypothetical protein
VAVAWLLPALALTSTSLALATGSTRSCPARRWPSPGCCSPCPACAPTATRWWFATLVPQLLCLVLLVAAAAVLLTQRRAPLVSGSPA